MDIWFQYTFRVAFYLLEKKHMQSKQLFNLYFSNRVQLLYQQDIEIYYLAETYLK